MGNGADLYLFNIDINGSRSWRIASINTYKAKTSNCNCWMFKVSSGKSAILNLITLGNSQPDLFNDFIFKTHML